MTQALHCDVAMSPVAAAAVAPAAVPSDARSYRLASIDMLRGLVIVIMALDHVRDYVMLGAEQDPTTNPDVGAAVFFTRWITHFCAPVFVCLTGTSAGLMVTRKAPSALGRFLLTRGLWLVFIDWFVVSTAWSFAPWGIAQIGGRVLTPLGVIWAIGASMIVLSGAQFLGRRPCLWLGAAVLLGHNLLDPIWPATNILDESGPWWAALHSQVPVAAGPFLVVFVYPLLPWIGVMLLGFGTSAVFEAPTVRRDARLAVWGLALTAAFLVLRTMGLYGDPNAWQPGGDSVRTIIDFLNTTKYPPSLLFLLMTLGPAAVFCSRADRLPDGLSRTLVTYGRAPFVFYVAHLYLIHAIALVVGVIQGFEPEQLLTVMFFFPKGYGLGLPGTYVIWLLVVAALYPLCRSMAALKARRRDWWLSYV
jgi:uncharacterized membrane protein